MGRLIYWLAQGVDRRAWSHVDRFFVAWHYCHGSSTNQDVHASRTSYSTLCLTPENTFASKVMEYSNHCASRR